ncbi:MAG: hypothetical protein IJN05_06365 [Ruminococcus sp.]|nr:hypothetical protein [Ruminococcus sp.]
MSEKMLLTDEDIEFLCDGEQKEFSNINELMEYIENDANAYSNFRRFLKKNNIDPKFDLNDGNIKDLIYKKKMRKKAFLDNFYIENDNAAVAEETPADTEPVVFTSDFDRIVSEMEQGGYKNIIEESDEAFSSIEVTLTETSVIENGELKVTWRKESALDTSKVLIMEKNGPSVLAVGYLSAVENTSGKYWVIFDNSDWIRYSSFEGKQQIRLIVYTADDNMPHSCVADINYKKMRTEKEKPLCIDFGTSNTTVGSYGIKTARDIETVKFVDVTVTPHITSARMIPTVVYVEDCSDKNNIKYLFGYEALKRIEQEEHYEFKASAFFEIKRWMSSPDSREEIKDNNNNTVLIERKKIIKAYVDYVIDKSEQYFGVRFERLHFSSPVKLKSSFIRTFKELYKGQKIVLDENESIDEAFSIVYNQIINIIDHENEDISGKDKSILIMDCGGGTTDLANCTFCFTRKNGFTNELKYTTKFENGNSNYGGNNITYRVMQLLKIKIAAAHDDSIKKDAMQLIDKTEDQILGIIETNYKNEAYNSDECSNEIYEKFISEYNRCEAIIPTKFAKNPNLDSYEIKCRKRNFYCMWRLAEKIKIKFFNSDKVQFDFGDKEVKELLVDSTNDYFYVNHGDKLEKEMNPLKGVTITNKDVERIICGDIYGLLYGLMKNGDLSDTADKKREIDSFDYYKLSGQSCKISMFKELLKEYIPGRKLRPYAQKESDKDNNSETLKLECLEGCIKFIKDQRGHELEIIPNIEKPKIIYNVFIDNEHGNVRKIFDCTDLEPQNTLFEIFSPQANEMSFIVKNKDDAIEKSFIMSLEDHYTDDSFDSAEKLIDVIMEEYAYKKEYVMQVVSEMCDKTDDVNENAKVIFVLPSPDYYGATILLVHRIHSEEGKTQYKLLYSMNVPFENPDKTFFDGKR